MTAAPDASSSSDPWFAWTQSAHNSAGDSRSAKSLHEGTVPHPASSSRTPQQPPGNLDRSRFAGYWVDGKKIRYRVTYSGNDNWICTRLTDNKQYSVAWDSVHQSFLWGRPASYYADTMNRDKLEWYPFKAKLPFSWTRLGDDVQAPVTAVADEEKKTDNPWHEMIPDDSLKSSAAESAPVSGESALASAAGSVVQPAPLVSEADPCRVLHRVRADFDGTEYGPDYISLQKDTYLYSDPDFRDEGWAYGVMLENGSEGWFPPAFVALYDEGQVERKYTRDQLLRIRQALVIDGQLRASSNRLLAITLDFKSQP